MQWLAEDVLYLSCAEEVSTGYVFYKAVEGQFSDTKPYQAREPPPSSVKGANGCQDPSQGRHEEDVPAPASDISQPAGTKRKRIGITKDAKRAAREHESQQRHLEVHEQLLRAHKIYQGSQDQQEELKASSRVVTNARHLEGSMLSRAAHAKLDLITLSHMKRAVRPELTIEEDDNTVAHTNLFDFLHINDRDVEIYADAAGHALLFPARSMFLIADITRLNPLLSDCPEQGFDCVVVDPPWENASAQRSSAYPTLPSRNLLGVPMKRLLHQERGVLALWVTNRERHRRFIDAELLPAWGLRHVATWHWLKVTNDGQLVSPLETAYRRPYEVLLLCQPVSAVLQAAAPEKGDAAGLEHEQEPHEAARHRGNQLSKPLQDITIIAVPGQHSRKPHLGRLLEPHLPTQPSCLEVFARELHAGWTSIGNETLLFQTLDHFTELQ